MLFRRSALTCCGCQTPLGRLHCPPSSMLRNRERVFGGVASHDNTLPQEHRADIDGFGWVGGVRRSGTGWWVGRRRTRWKTGRFVLDADLVVAFEAGLDRCAIAGGDGDLQVRHLRAFGSRGLVPAFDHQVLARIPPRLLGTRLQSGYNHLIDF